MKSLKKLQLNDAKVLSNSEMKHILGGTGAATTGGGSGTKSTCNGSVGGEDASSLYCGGTCPKIGEYQQICDIAPKYESSGSVVQKITGWYCYCR